MQHETLSVNLDADPLDVTVYLRLFDVNRQHVALDSLRVVRLEKGIVVEVAAKFPMHNMVRLHSPNPAHPRARSLCSQILLNDLSETLEFL